MQCVRCGKTLNQEDRRCPRCLASLSNQDISQLELAQHQLRELADIERSNMTTPHAKQSAVVGAVIGGLGMLLTNALMTVIAGPLVGALVGWFVAWRRWGQYRSCLLFAGIMMPLTALITRSVNPFAILGCICTGMAIGIVIQLNRDG